MDMAENDEVADCVKLSQTGANIIQLASKGTPVSKRETPMTEAYWKTVGGVLIEEYPVVRFRYSTVRGYSKECLTFTLPRLDT